MDFSLTEEQQALRDLAAQIFADKATIERIVGLLGLSAKIFRAELRGATDVSKIPALECASCTPAGKTLLFTRATLANNFEGIALGPKLEGGWRSLILIADSGGGTTHWLMPLRIRWSAK